MRLNSIKIAIFSALLLLFFTRQIVFAEESELECSTTYEVTVVKSDGHYSKLLCTDSLIDAKEEMNSHNSTATAVASIFKGTKLIDTKYGLLKLKTKSALYDTYIYEKESEAYNGGYDFITASNGNYGTDAAMLNISEGYNSSYIAKMVISGYTGYMRSFDMSGRPNFEVVPISLVKSPTYYTVSSGNLVHYFGNYIDESSSYIWHISIGPAPDFLEEGFKYYSFDGNYFYTSLLTMLEDYKNETYNNSVNPIDPYYNYYMYLSNRTKTTYTAADLDWYITDVKGYTEKALSTDHTLYSYQSMMFDEGESFIYAQNTFGANAMISMGAAINESGWGRSSIARDKRNLYGYGASTSNAYSAAAVFPSVANSIYFHGDYVVSSKWCDTETDDRYFGCHFGNKNSGMNVTYATDPYWGEKMAANYYTLDKAMGLQDYGMYKTGIKIMDTGVNVRKEANTSSDVIYVLNNTFGDGQKITNMPVVILGEVTGEEINGNNIWYKVQTDPTLDGNKDALVSPSGLDPRPTYNWDNNYGYVHSELIYTNNSYIRTDNKFYFNGLSWNEDTDTLNISGFLVAKGIDNSKEKAIAYSLILENVDTKDEYIIEIDRWTEDVPFKIPGEDGYDYSGAWFKDSIDLSILPEGDYKINIRARTSTHETLAIFRNIFGSEMVQKITDSSGRGYQFRTNYYNKEMPLELFVRDEGLISSTAPVNSTNMFNVYKNISFEGNNLSVRGTSYNVGVDYAASKTVERHMVLENTETYERYEYNIGSITDGDHEVVLRVPDGLSKTRAWYDASIDLSDLPEGTYAIFIKTKVNSNEDAFELNDIFERNLPEKVTINNKEISLSLNKNKRYRIELEVK